MNNENIENVNDAPVMADSDEKQQERLFTQEEVNAILKKRLSRSKEPETASTISEAELTARAALLDCREYVLENNLSKELLDIIPTDDVTAFKEKAARLSDIMKQQQPDYPVVRDNGELLIPKTDGIQEAFSANAAHIPKQYNPYG